MKTEDSQTPRRGNPTRLENAAGGKKGSARKLATNEIDALWDEVIAHRIATFHWTPPKQK